MLKGKGQAGGIEETSPGLRPGPGGGGLARRGRNGTTASELSAPNLSRGRSGSSPALSPTAAPRTFARYSWEDPDFYRS